MTGHRQAGAGDNDEGKGKEANKKRQPNEGNKRNEQASEGRGAARFRLWVLLFGFCFCLSVWEKARGLQSKALGRRRCRRGQRAPVGAPKGWLLLGLLIFVVVGARLSFVPVPCRFSLPPVFVSDSHAHTHTPVRVFVSHIYILALLRSFRFPSFVVVICLKPAASVLAAPAALKGLLFLLSPALVATGGERGGQGR